jgi:tight adherence protein B
MDFQFYAFSVLIFVAVFLAIEGIWQWWFSTQSKAARRTSRRLNSLVDDNHQGRERASLLKERRLAESAATEIFLRRIPGIGAVDNILQQSGSKWSVGNMLAQTAMSLLAGFFFALLLQPYIVIAIFAALACSTFPALHIARKRHLRLKKIERQLPEAADLIARSLRAGHAFPSTLQMVAEELPDPIASEFRIVADEINYGVAMADALPRLAMRVPLTDLSYMVIAVLIQRETGGNLAELMNNISSLLRERLKLLGQVRTLSAEGRLSAWILSLLPVAVGLLMFLVNPSYIKQLTNDEAGFVLLMLACAMMFCGALWMRMIIRIRV